MTALVPLRLARSNCGLRGERLRRQIDETDDRDLIRQLTNLAKECDRLAEAVDALHPGGRGAARIPVAGDNAIAVVPDLMTRKRKPPNREKPPAWIKPQLALLVKEAPAGDARLHEIRCDGYRLHARMDGERPAADAQRPDLDAQPRVVRVE